MSRDTSTDMSPERNALADAHLRATDPVMARLIDRFGPCALTVKNGAPFEVLAAAIISQLLSNKAAATIQNRVVAQVGPLTAAALARADARISRAQVDLFRALGGGWRPTAAASSQELPGAS